MTYSPQFLQAHAAYLAHTNRASRYRTGKKAAYSLWTRLDLDQHIETVLQWIETVPDVYAPRYVPALEVWLKKHDFTEAPPVGDKAQDVEEEIAQMVRSGIHPLTARRRAEGREN